MGRTAINSGQLREQVQYIVRVKGQDATGGPDVTDGTPSAAIWARVETISGREFDRDGVVSTEETTHIVTTRYYAASTAGLTTSDAFLWNSRTLEIEAINNVGNEDVYIEFACREVG